MWIKNLAGEKAQIDDADREYWVGLHGWSETDEPDDNFRGPVWMIDPESGRAAPIAWDAREYWLGRGRVPSPPDKPVNPTKDPVLTAVPAVKDKPAAKPPATPKPKSEKDS